MRKLFLITVPLLLLTPVVSSPALNHSGRIMPSPGGALDIYGNICWEDEKARLDNFAIELQGSTEWRGLIIVYAGSRSCAGEARVRGERAKEWVVGRNVPADRVFWKDGGYRENAETWLWIIPPDLDEKHWPVLPSLEPGKFRVFSKCKGRIYKPVNCDKP